MKPLHLFLTAVIIACSAVAWFILAATVRHRTHDSTASLGKEVSGVWGPPLVQQHPSAWLETPNTPGGRMTVAPAASHIDVDISSNPKQRGLIWHRTYDVTVSGRYEFRNPTRIPQTLYLVYPLPDDTSGLTGFQCDVDGASVPSSSKPPANGQVTRAITLPAEGAATLVTRYTTRGTDQWRYHFAENRRVPGFTLAMRTNFPEINFPVGTGSPTEREVVENGYSLIWHYPDILNAPDIGMDMPKQLNAGPVAARIAFFAPVSLLFFVTIVVLVSGVRGTSIHPMHIFFVTAGFFAFHLLFAYLADLVPLVWSFAAASLASVILVCGYLGVVGGRALLVIALPAQIIYLVAFSSSFFIDGLTGITLTVLGILTLAILMFLTARTDWSKLFSRKPTSTPPVPPLPRKSQLPETY